ncbi:NUDIX hydrolase [Actinoplanes sp. TFC3]|uniref:NUDIX hydrolase n=1 Tax=Actinoplanes sp. TFC3 TaxID=1710355 RepID=UPI00082E4816|nr:NUDIX hydrolase [Actinoplanes sp. TFC3]
MSLPPAMVQRAREFTGPPAPARPAATVVLLNPENLQVYVLKRASTMVFAGVHAFPGGRVDPGDHPETIRLDWAQRLGVPDEQARAVVGAAVRELFEEAGVLLAGPVHEPDRTVADVSGPGWEADRVALVNRELSLHELLTRRGLRLRDDLLLPWARWITPEFEPKRFDTWFFVALLPEAQSARDVSGEAEGTAWVDPGDVGGLTMLPPTRVTLGELGSYRKIDEVMAAQRDAAVPIMPRVELTADGGAVATF